MISWRRARTWIPWVATTLGGLFLLYDKVVKPAAHEVWWYWERPAFAEIRRVEVKEDAKGLVEDSTLHDFKGALYDMVDIMDSPPNSEIRHELVHSFKKKHR